MLSEQKIQNIINDSQAGAWLIDKPEDWTSHDVIAKLRGLSKIKAIGHTGTLDPFATGLLICLTGKATKLVDYFHDFPKTYLAEIKLGCVSDTYDRTGKIENKNIDLEITEDKIKKTLMTFLGKQQQLPPMFSAKKIDGRKLYQLARQGQEVERQPSQIEIFKIDPVSFKADEQLLTLRIVCSTGTYIRSLTNDLGQKLGLGAVLWQLRRENIGPFSVTEAIPLAQANQELLLKKMILSKKILAILPQLC